MTTHALTAHATRAHRGWTLHTDNDPEMIIQVTQLNQAETCIRHALALVPAYAHRAASIPVTVVVDGEIESRACALRTRLAELHREEKHARAEAAATARQLADRGYTYRDIGYLLGITYGRVGQILKNS
nr:hypothetical protein [Corynebacterium lactis]